MIAQVAIHPAAQHAVSFGDEPIVLIGEPQRCAGVLHVHNPQRTIVRLRRLRLRATAELANLCGSGQGLDLSLPMSLCEGETRMHKVALRLPSSTPPGVYQAQLEGADGKACPVSIHVLERRRTRLSPGTSTHTIAPGGSFTVTIVVSNHGNVDAEIPTRAALELHDGEVGWPHHFHAVAKLHGDEGYEKFLDAFVKRVGDAEPGVGRVKITEGAGMLAPAASRVLTLEASLPKTLHSGRVYRARVRLADTRLSVKLYVQGSKSHSSSPPSAG